MIHNISKKIFVYFSLNVFGKKLMLPDLWTIAGRFYRSPRSEARRIFANLFMREKRSRKRVNLQTGVDAHS